MKRIQGWEVTEEHPLAGTVAGLLYLTAAVTATSMLLVPGVDAEPAWVILAVSGLGAAWGTACLTIVPWGRTPPIVSHLSSSMGFPCTALAVAVTGGANSPCRFYFFFIVFFCCYFYAPRAAVTYVSGCVVAHALPLLYDGAAIGEGFIAELLVVTLAYLLLGGLIIAGKQLLIDLRSQAVELSLHDPLTGLPNRRAVLDFLDAHIEDSGGEPLGLALVDLDGFKGANTLHGHPAGDRVLAAAATTLRDAVRDEDMVARLGGDEFAVVVPGASAADMTTLADRILDAVRLAGVRLRLADYDLTVSAGWALWPADGSNAPDLVVAADVALRRAKADGKDRWRSALAGLPPDALPEPA